MGTTGALVFTGISTFSNDFQTILSREQQIEAIPITALKNHQSDLLQKKQLLITLNTAVGSLGSSIAALGSVAATQGVTATSSDTTKVTVTSTGASTAAIYPINSITSLAAPASGMSAAYASSTTTPVSVAGANTVQLVFGSATKNITLTNQTNNLVGVRDAINKLGVGVTASIVTVDATHNYLSLSANAPGQTTLQLQDVPSDGTGQPNYGGTLVNLLASTNNGTNAMFMLNNIPVTRSTNTINDLIPGVSFTLQDKTAATVNISLATDPTRFSNAIQTFVQSYNALQDQLNAQIGPAAGQLSGDTLISTLGEDMWQLGTYQGPGSIKSLADMGVTFDTSGKLSFDSTVFNSLSATQIGDVAKFFGSSTSGFGALASRFTQLSDPTLGLIRQQEDGYDQQNTQITDQINTMTERNALTQQALNARLQAADAMVAQLQSQQTLLSASIQSLNYSLFGYQTNPGTPNNSKNSTTG